MAARDQRPWRLRPVGDAELTDPKTFRVGLTEAIEALYLEPSEFAREGATR